nr:MAG TPA: hypothetical protein [Caudoviricetes sp.]
MILFYIKILILRKRLLQLLKIQRFFYLEIITKISIEKLGLAIIMD